MTKITLKRLKQSVAKSLQDFGYRSVTPAMIGEIYTAYRAGKREHDLPHGIIGMFAERQFSEAFDAGMEVDESKP